MKKEDLNQMLSLVDEKYINEITEPGFHDFDSEIEVSGEVQVVKHVSHWRTWAAAAAALIVCVGFGGFLARQAVIRQQEFSVGSEASVDFIESLSEEELDNYFLNEIENLPDFPHTQIDSRTEHIIPPIGKNQADTGNIGFSQTHDYAEFSMVNPGTCAVIMRVFDTAPDLDFSQAEAYHIDDYDVDFYGVYGQTVSEPMPYSQSFFSYHGRMYHLYTDTLDKKEVIRLVYEILDSDFSAKSLYLEYATTEEDLIPYFTELPSDVSDLDYYHETALYQQYGDYYENSVDNIAPPIAGNWFDRAEQLFLNNGEDKTARFNMATNDHSLLLAIYDNPQIDMSEFTSLNPCHIDGYDIDFYGIYKTQDGDPIHNSTMGIFRYHDKLYILHTTDFSRKETMKIVYEILDSELSANDLYEQYKLDIQSDEELQAYFKGVPEHILDPSQEDSAPVDPYFHIENVSLPIKTSWSNNAQIFFTSADGTAPATKAQIDFLNGSELPACVQVYDRITELPESFAETEPYHLDDYDVDIYGKFENDSLVQALPHYHSITYFEYHNRFYLVNTNQLSRKETIQLIYDVLDADFSASGLYEQYTGDIVSSEDERTTEETVPETVLDLHTANHLDFCYGLVPEFYALSGENQRAIDGGNMTMSDEITYENTYDDSDLIFDADSIRYDETAGDGTGYELFYQCELSPA